MISPGAAQSRRVEHVFRLPTILRLTIILGLGSLLLGCASDGSVDATARDASVYQAVITDLGERFGQRLDAPDGEVPVVFIETLGPQDIALQTQVEVIAKLADTYDIRFIDDLDEAIELDVDRRPVRMNSLLIGLGPIQVEDKAEVRGEVYVNADEIHAFRYSLVSEGGDGDGWTLGGPPEEAVSEGFQPTP